MATLTPQLSIKTLCFTEYIQNAHKTSLKHSFDGGHVLKTILIDDYKAVNKKMREICQFFLLISSLSSLSLSQFT